MNWTPGPWQVRKGNYGNWIDGPNPYVEADARLMAAAPEMAEALHDVVYGHTIGSFERARALLDRIRGEA